MADLESQNTEDTSKKAETTEDQGLDSELVLVDSIEINKDLTINFYSKNEKTILGLEHFKFEDEVLLKGDTMKKIIEVFNLKEKEKDLKKSLKNAGFKR